MALHEPKEIVPSADIQALPRLAAVAFAAHCGDYALALLQRLPWTNPQFRTEHIPHLAACVERARRLAATGAATEIPDRRARTERADRDAVREWSEVWDDEYIPWTDALRSAVFACDAAASADAPATCAKVLSWFEDVLGHMAKDADLASAADRVPRMLHENVVAPRAVLRADFEKLKVASLRGRWRDDTRVSVGFFSDPGLTVAVIDFSAKLCRQIAQCPDSLWHVEWRDLERVVAHTLEGFGFDVTLTPPAKDGGRDVIATCVVRGRRQTYYVEIKHWTSGKRVSLKSVEAFVEVNVRDGTDGGVFLSTSGYTEQVYRARSEISRQQVRLGTDTKIVHLCQTYVQRHGETIWEAERVLPDVLLAETV